MLLVAVEGIGACQTCMGVNKPGLKGLSTMQCRRLNCIPLPLALGRIPLRKTSMPTEQQNKLTILNEAHLLLHKFQ